MNPAHGSAAGERTLWIQAVGDAVWQWGRAGEPVGRIHQLPDGGLEPVDVLDDLDLVTALLMVREGLDTLDLTLGPPTAPTTSSAGTWQRSTTDKAKKPGVTLQERYGRS